MARKVFISFLGTNKYTECNYCSSSGLVEKKIAFVQEATIQHYCLDYDLFLFFLTKEAREKNWDGKNGLCARLKNIDGIKGNVIAKDIPNGFNINEIWGIFQTVFDQIKSKDQLVFDITHAFRSLPMLGMVLINYLKAVKNVEINGIYYGAFEALGHPSQVKEMPIEDRNVEILDLIGFSLLQDWTTAANNFYEFGNVEKLTELVNKEIKPVLAKSKGKDVEANLLRRFIKPLPGIFNDISAVRAYELYKPDRYNNVKNALSEIDSDNMPQLKPLLEQIEEKIAPFKNEESILNGFHVVRLCLDYGWTQQAYTMLIETLVSFILDKEDLDWKNEANRNVLNAAFTIVYREIPYSEWNYLAKENMTITKKLIDSNYVRLLKDDFVNLIDCRNDINHAGIRENPMSAQKLKYKLDSIYCNIISKVL